MIKNIKKWIKSASIWFAIVVALVYIFMACVTGIVASNRDIAVFCMTFLDALFIAIVGGIWIW